MTRTNSTYLAVVAILLSPMAAHAGPLALDILFDDPAPDELLNFTFGWEFSITEALTVDALGAWDHDADGLNFSQNVSLWTDLGVLLGSIVVDNTATAVASAETNGQWLMADVADIFLGTGNYVISVDRFGGSGDVFLFVDTVITTDSRVTFEAGRFNDASLFPGGLFGFPDNLFSADPGMASFFGPTFSIADTVPVPEPGTLALFGMGLAGMGLARRRRTA